MSLKSQLRIAIVTLVTLLVIAQSLLSLRLAAEDKIRDSMERAQVVADQIKDLVIQRVNEQARAVQPPPASMEARKRLWHHLVASDPELPGLLFKAAANATTVIEAMVADDANVILASTLPAREKQTFPPLPDLSEWQKRPLWERLVEVLIQPQRHDYAITFPLGVQSEPRPILNIRVVISTVLIRNAIIGHVQQMAWVSLLTLMASIVLAYLFSNYLLRSLDRLSARIESIATGQFTPSKAASAKEAKEFADMQSKLDVLSQQFRGAQEDTMQLRSNIERMIEALEEGTLLFDPDQKLVRASKAAEQLLGIRHAQVAGRTLNEVFPPSTPLGAILRDAVQKDQGVRDAAVTVERGEAGPLRLLVNVESLESFPEPGRDSLLVTVRNAETRHQIRSQLDISTRLAAISRLTGGVAHEIKNPLNAMALHLEILKSKLDGDERVGKEVEVIGGEIARLDRVVKTFLDFTRPVEVKLRDLNLVELARQVAALVWPEAERSHVSIEFDAPSPRVVVRADPDLLKQALLNVVNNGIEAMKSGGRLVVAVNREEDEAVVTVTDQGGGVPESVRDKIFNLYFTTKQKGSGIGLAMTFRIIQLHNATIDFASRVGDGTTFRMRFPLVDASSEPATPAHAGGASAVESPR